MTQHTTNSIRNVVLASYAGAGKTSLAEALVYSAGVIPTMGATLTGNTVGDFEPEEVHHHHSMSTALLHFDFKEISFNILDTPGTLDFLADTKSTIHVADAAVLVIGASGLRSEIERVWDVIQEREIPSVIFVNELDKEHTNFESTLEEISQVLEITCIPIAIPLGQEAGFEGVIDLLNQKVVIPVPNSHKIQETDVPAELQGKVDDARKVTSYWKSTLETGSYRRRKFFRDWQWRPATVPVFRCCVAAPQKILGLRYYWKPSPNYYRVHRSAPRLLH